MRLKQVKTIFLFSKPVAVLYYGLSTFEHVQEGALSA